MGPSGAKRSHQREQAQRQQTGKRNRRIITGSLRQGSLRQDRFILRDDVNEVWYHLDDQAQAQKHFGKDVVVTGVLDGRSDMIHVRNIVEVKP